ncbi:hypothetical protein B4109_1601 [Geobacillus stearothermophilus]|uniref:Uncharacterized protein n=1 Tax=Geobacillus stearothermophilus TaxID=1422 RepID=A0A150MER9_GEOSE|nr:hypothetical protein B4109_1601 [Geobacillus stearothermophilus]
MRKNKAAKNDVVVLSSKFTGLAMEFHAIIELDPKLARILCITVDEHFSLQ